jgi:hypothetical protein
MDHIAVHFQDGLNISSWRAPFPRPKDFRPGFKPQPGGDGNDSDDDMDDNDSNLNRQTIGVQPQSKSNISSQNKCSSDSQSHDSSFQGGRRYRHQVSQANLDNDAQSFRNQIPRQAKISVSLERYLNDAEEHVEIRLSLGSFRASYAPLESKILTQRASVATPGLMDCSGSFQDKEKCLTTVQSNTDINRISGSDKILDKSYRVKNHDQWFRPGRGFRSGRGFRLSPVFIML